MTETYPENTKKDDFALTEDLERRFGPAMAQQIMDELKKAERPQKVATGFNYIGAKALSEAAERITANPPFHWFAMRSRFERRVSTASTFVLTSLIDCASAETCPSNRPMALKYSASVMVSSSGSRPLCWAG